MYSCTYLCLTVVNLLRVFKGTYYSRRVVLVVIFCSLQNYIHVRVLSCAGTIKSCVHNLQLYTCAHKVGLGIIQH